MANLLELFRTRTITDGPNAGKTAEQAYAVQNSKDLPVVVENPLLQPLVEKINKRRKTNSLRLGENRLEQETVGLRAITDTSKLILYGGDYFRIINGNTRSKQLMLKNAGLPGAGLSDTITDKIGNAVGNLAGDSIQNIFLKRDDRVRPRLDTRALGIDIGADLLSRTVGRILPDPLIPSKVIELAEKGRGKREQFYLNEYDIDKRNKDILNRKSKGLDKLLQGILKEGTDSIGQTKDFLISKAGTIASGLVREGVASLSRIVFQGKKKGKGGRAKTTLESDNFNFKYSSTNKYTEWNNAAKRGNPNGFEQGGLSEEYLRRRLAALNINAASISEDELDFGIGSDIPTGVAATRNFQTNLERKTAAATKQAQDDLQKTPSKYSERARILKTNRNTKRGMSYGIDLMNFTNKVTYEGRELVDVQSNEPYDSFDFIPLKFYSIYNNETVQFRCTISDLTETFSPSWETNKFIGNPFSFYTYSGIERSVSFSFKVFSLNLEEHKLAWERIEQLSSLTYPQGYRGRSNAVVPPIIEFTLGNMYKNKECFIENLSFTVENNTPWEIGLNQKLYSNIFPVAFGGFAYAVDESEKIANNFKLPMIVNAEITLKFIEGRNNTSNLLYAYNK